MPKVFNFYIDDSGTRHPDHKPQESPLGWDWFALGGVIIDQSAEERARDSIIGFRKRWPQIGDSPFHSQEIRRGRDNFSWLMEDKAIRERFMSELGDMLCSLPVHGLACVIDRTGYNRRYREKYGPDRWSLCRTAFAISVERAVKHAQQHGAKLSVFPERCSKTDDAALKRYFREMKAEGHPFDSQTAASYNPPEVEAFKNTLYDFGTKQKSSPMAQLADLFLYPMCMGGYDADHRPYRSLYQAGRLLDCEYPDAIRERGIKYSCFDWVERRAQKHKDPTA